MIVEEHSYTLPAQLVDEWRLAQATLCNCLMVLQDEYSEQQKRLPARQPGGVGVFPEYIASRNPGPRRRGGAIGLLFRW
jgi:hypothetical protein